MNLNKLYKEEFYLFLEEFTEKVINNIKKFPNLSIIYNNPVVSDLDNFLTLSNFCKKNNINLYIVDNFEVFLKFKLSGIVLSDFNKNFPFKIVNYQKKNIKIIGKVHSVFGEKYISICNSKQQLKYLIVAYVRYLAMLAEGKELEFVFISKYVDGLQTIPAGIITQQEAIDTMSQYLEYYKKGHQNYFHFFPVIGKNEMEMISGNYETFMGIYEDARDKELDFSFEDDYLNKAVEHGFFDELVYLEIQQNAKAIFDPINFRLPLVFKKINN